MLSIFNMHIQFAWGEYLHFTDPTCPPNSPLFFFFLLETILSHHKLSYIHKCTVTLADMLHLFTINTISKPIESDQNANGEHGNPCSVKKKQSKHHILIGGGSGAYKKF